MSKKIYICNECGFNFPIQLSGLIENNIQVFCEKCGAESKKMDFNAVDLKKNLKELYSVAKDQAGKAFSKRRKKIKTMRKKEIIQKLSYRNHSKDLVSLKVSINVIFN